LTIADVGIQVTNCFNVLFCVFQKMDKNKDGVVTLDEFLESCQEVRRDLRALYLQVGGRKSGVWAPEGRGEKTQQPMPSNQSQQQAQCHQQ
jgi:hypothetical protein